MDQAVGMIQKGRHIDGNAEEMYAMLLDFTGKSTANRRAGGRRGRRIAIMNVLDLVDRQTRFSHYLNTIRTPAAVQYTFTSMSASKGVSS